MTIEELQLLIEKTVWFGHLAEPATSNGFVHIASLNPWANIPAGDDRLEEIADQMEWLPSSRDQDDPIHGRLLEQRSDQLGKKEEHSRQSLETYKAVLSSLRNFDGHPALKAGPHDFTEAARGAAAYAAKRAAYEVLLDDCGFWCSVMNRYAEGRWPCGILPSGEVIVL